MGFFCPFSFRLDRFNLCKINNVEKVTFNMATMPPRIKALEESIPKILMQCDELNVYCNNFDSIPKILKQPKIKVFLSQDHVGDMGDVGKFFVCDTWKEGYIFTADDKILYPPDYVKRSIEEIEKYKRKAVIGWHGRIFHDRPCKTYYYDTKLFRGILMGYKYDEWVHEIGTGGLCFHVDTIPEIDINIFERINMTDIFFSMWLQRLKIPMLNPKRIESWIKISNKHDDNYSIHNIWNKKDQIMTETVNKIKWQIFKPK